MILLTGAAGKTGKAIIKALDARGHAIRGLVRRAEQVAPLKHLGVQDVIVGDMRDQVTMSKSMRGVRAVYHMAPNMHPEEIAIGQGMLKAAQAADVEQVVYHSVLHPQTKAMPHHWQKLHMEELLFESGLPFTILQPAAYMQNVLAYWPAILENRTYALPYSAKTRISIVDLHDVAEVAARVLTEPGHVGAIYELCGPEPLSQHEVASILAEHIGHPVQVELIPLATWKSHARASGLGAYQIETLAKMFAYYDQHGFWGNANVLGWLLERAPTTFSEFVRRTLQETATDAS